MYRKMVIALIVVGSFVIGYTSFIGSTARASHNCSSDSTVLAANPELNVVCKNDVIAGDETEALRAIEASAARYSAMAEYYLAQNETNVQRANDANAARYTGLAGYYAAAKGTTSSTFLASNPELMAYNRYALEAHPTQSSSLSSLYAANPELMAFGRAAATEVEWHRKHFPGR